MGYAYAVHILSPFRSLWIFLFHELLSLFLCLFLFFSFSYIFFFFYSRYGLGLCNDTLTLRRNRRVSRRGLFYGVYACMHLRIHIHKVLIYVRVCMYLFQANTWIRLGAVGGKGGFFFF